MRDHTTGLGGDTPREGARTELRDPTIDQDQKRWVPWRRPWPPPGTLEDRRRSMLPGVPKELIHPFPADMVACGKRRDTLATMIGRDDLPGIISRYLLHTPCRLECQVIRRLYSSTGAGSVPLTGAAVDHGHSPVLRDGKRDSCISFLRRSLFPAARLLRTASAATSPEPPPSPSTGAPPAAARARPSGRHRPRPVAGRRPRSARTRSRSPTRPAASARP
jgi:hypothetical protein